MIDDQYSSRVYRAYVIDGREDDSGRSRLEDTDDALSGKKKKDGRNLWQWRAVARKTRLDEAESQLEEDSKTKSSFWKKFRIRSDPPFKPEVRRRCVRMVGRDFCVAGGTSTRIGCSLDCEIVRFYQVCCNRTAKF